MKALLEKFIVPSPRLLLLHLKEAEGSPGLHRRVEIRKLPLVGWNLPIRVLELVEEEVPDLLLGKGEVDEPKRTLADMEPGEEGIVSHISDEDPELLRHVDASGLRPGAVVRLGEAAPFDGPLTVAVGSERHPIGQGVARKVFVAPPV